MNDLVSLVMEAAAIELLHGDAVQIDREVQRLLAEMEHAPVEELRRSGFARHFLELLKRRGELARKALIIFEELQSEGPRAPEPFGPHIGHCADIVRDRPAHTIGDRPQPPVRHPHRSWAPYAEPPAG
jgi:hypothetical protein